MTAFHSALGPAAQQSVFRRSRNSRSLVKSARDWVGEVNRRRRDREALRAMTPDQLEDIGVSFADVARMSIFPRTDT